ncbi:hypothetical protein LXL04_033123 [Taraxacum kok-saghyz]
MGGRKLRVDHENRCFKDLVRIGQLWLHANVSRRPRNVGMPVPTNPPKFVKPQRKIEHPSRPKVVSFASVVAEPVDKPSYATVASNRNADHGAKEAAKAATTSIPLDTQVMFDNQFPYAVIGCYKDFRAIENARCLCQGEGFLDVEPMYLGGLWVLFNFSNTVTRDNFLAHEAFYAWFSVLKPWHNDFVLKPWHNDFVVEDRIVWLEVEGIPLLAWGNETFHKIASKWGELVFVDNTDGSNRFSIRLGVKSKHATLVFESTFVTVQRVEYCIRVRELSSWTPNFIPGFKDAEYDTKDGDCESERSDTSSNVVLEDDVVPDQKGMPQQPLNIEANGFPQETPDSDPFNLAPLIAQATRKTGEANVDVGVTTAVLPAEGVPGGMPVDSDQEVASASKEFLPGFTPCPSVECNASPKDVVDHDAPGAADTPGSFSSAAVGNSKVLIQSFSVVEKLDSVIAVGKALGWDMTGCINTLRQIITENGASIGFQ